MKGEKNGVPTKDKLTNLQSYSNPDLPLSSTLCKTIINFLYK